jgi:hypothetical protein
MANIDWNARLDEKYRLLGMETAAQAEQNRAQAQLQRENAAMVRPLGEAQIKQDLANARKLAEEAMMVRPIGESLITGNLATAGLAGAQAAKERRVFPLGGEQGQGQDPLRASLIRPLPPPSEDFMREFRAGIIPPPKKETEPVYYEPLGMPLKRGITRVPGKGSGDKVPAMLEPGEAILNKKAAGMIGRDKIAAANKKGNQMRTQAEKSKVAQLLKKLGMV